MKVSPPPIGIKCVDDKGFCSPVLRDCLVSYYNAMGSNVASVVVNFGEINTINQGDISISLPGLNIGGLIWEDSYTVSQAITINDATLQSVDLAVATTHYLYPVGIILPLLGNTPQAGFIQLTGTIGNAGSGASNLASAATQDLYILIWNSYSDSYCPVISGRGTDALSDFNAGKTIALPSLEGRIVGFTGTVDGLTNRTLEGTVGTETETLTTTHMPAHTHTYGGQLLSSSFGTYPTDVSKPAIVVTAAADVVTSSQGGDGSHNNMQPTAFYQFQIKL